MKQLAALFWEICRFRAAPQDVPTSQALAVASLAFYTLVGVFMSLFELSVGKALSAALVDVALLAILSYVVLWIRLWTERWYQTVTALAGCGSIIGLLAFPLGMWRVIVGPESHVAAVPTLLMIGLMVWNLIIIAHILRHALSVHVLLGGVLAGIYMYISLRVITILFFVPK